MDKYMRWAVAVAAATLLGWGNLAYAATATPLEIDAEFLAKIAKERTKRAGTKNATAETGREQSPCGSLDIGNVFASRSGRTPREVTVIVTGDVINAGNKCK
jgi:hypothetical protein